MPCATCNGTSKVWNGLLQEYRGCPDCNALPCPECGGDGYFEEVAQGSFGTWEMQRFKCRACDGNGWIGLEPSNGY